MTTDLAGLDGLIVDLDGVVWIGPNPVPGAAEALAALRARGTKLLFLTNDPRSRRADYVARLRGLGIDATDDDVFDVRGSDGRLPRGSRRRAARDVCSRIGRAEG